MGRLGQTRLFHAPRFAGLEPWSSFQPLQPSNLGALIFDHPLQLGDVAHQADDQRLQLGWRQIVEISGRRHAATKPEIALCEKPRPSDLYPSRFPHAPLLLPPAKPPLPGLLPLLLWRDCPDIVRKPRITVRNPRMASIDEMQPAPGRRPLLPPWERGARIFRVRNR